jgi:hypothetical protein
VKTAKSTAIRPKSTVQRPKLSPISEEMRQWSALLEAELLSWPGVTAKPMFGFRALYKGKTIFAALPHSRGFGSTPSLILKFDPMPPALLKHAETDPRLETSTRVPGKGWFSFALDSEADLRDAVWWLNHSYESAKGGSKR